MPPIYSTFTSDINSLPRFACASCQIGNMHSCVCLWFADLWEQRVTKILLIATGFCVSSLSCPVLKKRGVNRCMGVFAVCYFSSFQFYALLLMFHHTPQSLKHLGGDKERRECNSKKHLLVELIDFITSALRLWSSSSFKATMEVCCNRLEHPVLAVNTVFLIVMEGKKEPTHPISFVQLRPHWWPISMTRDLNSKLEAWAQRKGDECWSVLAAWTDIRETW